MSADGTTTGRCTAFNTRPTCSAANWPGGMRARLPGLSIARASRVPKKGGASDPHCFDAGKKSKGKKRYVLVGTQGLSMHSLVHSAGMQDRGGVLPMASLFRLFPFLLKLHADSGYTGPKFENGLTEACRQVDEIVRRSDAGTFVVLPKRWIAERTIGWLNRCRRLAKDWPKTGSASAPTAWRSCAGHQYGSWCQALSGHILIRDRP